MANSLLRAKCCYPYCSFHPLMTLTFVGCDANACHDSSDCFPGWGYSYFNNWTMALDGQILLTLDEESSTEDTCLWSGVHGTWSGTQHRYGDYTSCDGQFQNAYTGAFALDLTYDRADGEWSLGANPYIYTLDGVAVDRIYSSYGFAILNWTSGPGIADGVSFPLIRGCSLGTWGSLVSAGTIVIEHGNQT